MCARTWLVSMCGVIMALATTAPAAPFFDTGPPDGLMGMASRPGPGPGSGANQETEAADDFILKSATTINAATFTGLVPASVNLASGISQVDVEIYRVFPNDSDTTRMPSVPTRMNSPSDVELASRSSADSSLTFTTNPPTPFAVTNSVDAGIHLPNPPPGGDGPMTGQAVQFNVTFTTPFDLPADHYFFVPQVLISNPDEHFLWLSAPRPIPMGVGTGPFVGDLQTWMRNADLDPDWLRVGTDIVGAGTFNASFSLTGTAVPEPSTLATSGMGLLMGLGYAWRRRWRKPA